MKNFKLKIDQLDFIPIRENVLIKRYVFTNENAIDLDVKFLLHSKLISDTNNLVGAKVINNGIIQYAHDNMLGIVSPKVPLLSHQINDTNSNINTGNISDKDYIGMSSDSSISYDIGVIKPKETKELVLFIKIKDEKDSYSLDDMEAELSKLDLKELTEYDKKVKRIYNRTILLYPLLTNDSTGGISASVEIDEDRTACGRYSYCWPRDAVFVTHAMDLLKMEKETEKFYKIFCKNTQSKNGMWEQRFFTDCRLAPCWGYQIDETASIVYGVFHHYEKCGNIKFLKDNLIMMEKAVKFLEEYVDDIINKTNKMHVSYDLWEMHEGIHFYSMVSIYSSFECM